MLSVISINLNGIRSAIKKGFFTWLEQQDADIICMQEIKAQDSDIQLITHPKNYHAYFHFAEKKGYSGVGIYTKKQPQQIITGLGWETADREGRYLEVDFGQLKVASVYLPSGSSGPERQAIKFAFLDYYAKHLALQKNSGQDYILCGDWNIAHKEIDLKNWRGNRKNSGFLPEERLWMDELFGNLQFVDGFRRVNALPDQYTWWSNRGRAREKNVGWRIDYQIVTSAIAEKIINAEIYTAEKFSDHAPLIMRYDITL